MGSVPGRGHVTIMPSAIVLLMLLPMQLPDGNEIQVGVDRFKVPELLFQPVSDTPLLKLCNKYGVLHRTSSCVRR